MELSTALSPASGRRLKPVRARRQSAHAGLRAFTLTLVGLAIPVSLHGQARGWVVGGHDVTVAVPDVDGPVAVSSRIHLEAADPQAASDPDASLTIELLLFGDVTISDLRRSNGDRVLMWPASGRRFVAAPLPRYGIDWRLAGQHVFCNIAGGHVSVKFPVETGTLAVGNSSISRHLVGSPEFWL